MVPGVNRAAQILTDRFRERGAQKRLSEETEIDQGYLSQLASGKRVAGLEVRRKLVPYGISLDDWEQPAPATSESGEHAAVSDKASGSAA